MEYDENICRVLTLNMWCNKNGNNEEKRVVIARRIRLRFYLLIKQLT